MELRKIVAIVRVSALEKVEERLRDLRVKGLSISSVRGYGEYSNLYKQDWMVSHARVEIFTEQTEVDAIVTAIMETAHTGIAGDGIVAVLPVEELFRIRTKSAIEPHEI
ncbi:MAG: P-II family nitrogen regulator [Deltaproteobacteria bacterium]|jgi:nitrogen regulatory protein P-II 1